MHTNFQQANHADTLTSLLALLSHPSEISEDQADEAVKSIVFVLDEFDLFTTHPRQTLLYNLFDIAQARKAPIVVLGITTRIDVVETLEKRVKSRFSHRYVHLSLPRNLPAFWEICKEGLLVQTEDLENEGFDLGISGQEDFISFWQSMIEVKIRYSAAITQLICGRISIPTTPPSSSSSSHISTDRSQCPPSSHPAFSQSPTYPSGTCLSPVESSPQAPPHSQPQTQSSTSSKVSQNSS